jgi:hypothetical protein
MFHTAPESYVRRVFRERFGRCRKRFRFTTRLTSRIVFRFRDRIGDGIRIRRDRAAFRHRVIVGFLNWFIRPHVVGPC